MLLAMRRASSRVSAMAKVKAVAREALSWFIAPDCGQLGGLSRRAAPIKSGDILCKEVVEHGAHNSNDGKFCDVFPSGRDRSAHYVGGKRKFERKQNQERRRCAQAKGQAALTDLHTHSVHSPVHSLAKPWLSRMRHPPTWRS